MSKCQTPRCKGAPLGSRKHCQKCRVAAWRASAPMKAAYAGLKSSAKERGIPFELTLAEFSEFAVRTKLLTGRGKSRDAWHVDRIRNGEGYKVGNIKVLTNSANASKENARRRTAKAVDQRNQMLEAGWPWCPHVAPQVEPDDRSFADEPVALKRVVTYDFHLKQGGITKIDLLAPPDPNVPF